MARAGMVVGLLGGSFDPAHEGHALITREAMKRMGLDRVWWLVSPGNPLKAHPPAPLADRLARAAAVMRGHPKVRITDLETRLGTVWTADTIRALKRAYPGVAFVWLMGADNLVQLHRWGRWRQIMADVPVGVLARPGWGVKARLSVAAQVFAGRRVGRGENLALRRPPAWVFVTLPMSDLSSTEIRARGSWRR